MQMCMHFLSTRTTEYVHGCGSIVHLFHVHVLGGILTCIFSRTSREFFNHPTAQTDITLQQGNPSNQTIHQFANWEPVPAYTSTALASLPMEGVARPPQHQTSHAQGTGQPEKNPHGNELGRGRTYCRRKKGKCAGDSHTQCTL